MTEAEWLRSEVPEPMIQLASERASARKLYLLAVGLWDRFPDLSWSADWRTAVRVAERYADGRATRQELGALWAVWVGKRPSHPMPIKEFILDMCLDALTEPDPGNAVYLALRCVADMGHILSGRWAANLDRVLGGRAPVYGRPEVVPEAVSLIRCVVGNPFRPVVAAPSWRTSTVLALARQMYKAREFSALPILADALQDAGCDNADVLDHCRGPGPHVRGCWVVDLVLGKA